MARGDFRFSTQLRVRWSETDAQGVVFNARYLDYADVAITEYYRAVGFRLAYPDVPFECHVKRATVTWEAPIKPDELIEVLARTSAVGRTSMTHLVEIHGANDEGRDDLRCTIELVNVHVDLATHRPEPLPDWAVAMFTGFEETGAVLTRS
jgi:acyl-CoA thioester hydrolase